MKKEALKAFIKWKETNFKDHSFQEKYLELKNKYHTNVKHTKKQYEIDILEEQLSEINEKGMNGVFKYLKNKKSSNLVDTDTFRSFYKTLLNSKPRPAFDNIESVHQKD